MWLSGQLALKVFPTRTKTQLWSARGQEGGLAPAGLAILYRGTITLYLLVSAS
jgi:hypothetical protein